MEAPGTSVLSSIPGTTRTLSSAPTRSASSRPSVLSRSVRAITRTPWACARRTTSPGHRRPAEMVLWRWRSSECMQGRLAPGAVSAISKTRDGYGRLALEEARPHQPRTRLTACGQDGACTHHTERTQNRRVSARPSRRMLASGPRLASVVDSARLPDHGDLLLAGVLERLLDLLHDVAREPHRLE